MRNKQILILSWNMEKKLVGKPCPGFIVCRSELLFDAGSTHFYGRRNVVQSFLSMSGM